MTESPGAGFAVTGTGSVRHLTLDRPHRRNAQTLAMWHAMDHAADRLAADEEVRCLIISGAGNTFSAGLDLAELAEDGALTAVARADGERDPSAAEGMFAALQRAFLWPTRAPFVTIAAIAAIEGVAIGAGMELALACDIRIVADTARLRLPEVSMGVVPDLGGCHLVCQLIGYERALDLIINSGGSPGLKPSIWGWRCGLSPPAPPPTPQPPTPGQSPICQPARFVTPRRH